MNIVPSTEEEYKRNIIRLNTPFKNLYGMVQYAETKNSNYVLMRCSYFYNQYPVKSFTNLFRHDSVEVSVNLRTREVREIDRELTYRVESRLKFFMKRLYVLAKFRSFKKNALKMASILNSFNPFR